MSLTQEPLIGGFFIKSAVFMRMNSRFFYFIQILKNSISVSPPNELQEMEILTRLYSPT